MDNLLSKKADTSDLDYLTAGLEGKVSVATLEKMTLVLENKADKSDLVVLNNERSSHQRSQQRLMEEEIVERLEQTRNNLTAEIKEVRQHLETELRRVEAGVMNTRREMEG